MISLGKIGTPKSRSRWDGTPKSDKDLLVEWQEYFSSLLNNDNSQTPSDLPQPAAQDLPIRDHPPTLEETLEAIRQMKNNKAAELDCAITAEALDQGVAVMQWQMLSIASLLKCTQIWHHLTSGSPASLSLCQRRVTWTLWPITGGFLCCQ